MKKDTPFVVLAITTGIIIGTLCARRIATNLEWGSYLWIFGALFGGVVGWIVADFRQLYAGVKWSFRVSKENLARKYGKTREWQPNKLYWKAVGTKMLGLGALIVSSLVVSHKEIFLLIGFTGKTADTISNILIFCLGCAMLTTINCDFEEKEFEKETEYGLRLFKFGNPVILPATIVYIFFLGLGSIIDLGEYAPRMLGFLGEVRKEIGRFAVRTFIYVHSGKRTTCLVWATLGVIYNYGSGNLIAGAVIGALLGGIFHEVVSVRLKLIPVRVK